MSEYDQYNPLKYITVEEIKKYRKENDVGLKEARDALIRNQVEDDFYTALYNKDSGLDIFEIIGYALFEMRR